MNKNLIFGLVCLFTLQIWKNEVEGQTKKMIHYWHFNNTQSGVHLGAIQADYTTLGNASLIYKPKPGGGSDTLQAYIDNLVPDASDTLNQRPGYGGCCGSANYAVRTRNPSDNMQFVWYIPTKKYQNILITYATQSSSTGSGQHRQVFSYSIDSAVTFVTAGLPVAYDSAGLSFGKVKLDLSSIPSVNNNNKFVFKMTFTAPNTGTSGNNRFDNITVEGDSMIAPVITSNALNTGIIGRLYSYIITATGAPAPSLTVSGNPSWLSLTGNILSGIPASIDTFGPITINATNAIGTSKQVFNLMIADSINPVAPAITSIAPTKGKVDSLINYIIRVTGTPKPTISVSGNPAWLNLSDSVLSGTPPADGIFGPITITATNHSGSAQQSFNLTIPAAPAITSTAIATAVTNSQYAYTITTTGTPAPGLSLSGIPAWLSLTDNVLSGTPLSAGTFGPITITAANTEGSTQQVFSILVSSAPVITSSALVTGTADSLYTYSITATGSPTPIFSLSGNPTWLSLNGNILSGTPVAAGIYGPVVITATNSVSFKQQIFYITVTNPALNTGELKLIHYWHFNNTEPGIHLGAIPADYSTVGNALIIYKPMAGGGADTAQAYMDNLAGDTINERAGYAGCCGTPNYAVRTRNPSDNMQFLWYIPTSNYRNIVIKYETESSSAASGQHRQIFSYSLDSASTFVTTGLPIAFDSASISWGKVILDLSSIPEVNNNNKLALRMTFSSPNTGTSGNNRFDNITVEGDTMIRPLLITNPVTSGIINRPYSYTIKAVGNPAPIFTVSGNPVWLTLNDSILSGRPTKIDTFGPITITATSQFGSSQQVFNLIIGDSINPVAPEIKSIAPTIGIVDSVFKYVIRTTGVPKPVLSLSGNPEWLILTDSVLSGIAPVNGVFGPITISATNILGSVQQTFSILVPAAPEFTSTAITTGVFNSFYTYAIAVSGTPTPDLSISGNPSWLSLNGNILSGLPSSVGTFGPITIAAKNTQGSSVQSFSIIVLSAPIIISNEVNTGIAGSAYTYTISALGTPAPTFSITGNPSWLHLNGNNLSGIPTSSGLIGPVSITATNSVSSDVQTFYIYVANPEVNTAGSKLIHYWHFNNSLPANGSGGLLYGPHPIRADYSSLANAGLVYEGMQGVVGDTGYIDNFIGDTLNQRPGFGGCCGEVNNAIRTRNPSDSMQFLWYIPTTNYKNIVIKYETELSSIKSGQHEQVFSYSLDSAQTFITTGLPVYSNFADSVWQLVTLDLRSIPEINNNSKFVVRINFSTPNTGTKGNNRFDNITVEGDSIFVVNSIHTYSSNGYILYPNPAKDQISLISSNENEKSILIYNSTGMLVSGYNIVGKEAKINTSALSPGFYFMKIFEKKGGSSCTLKFAKE